MAVSSASRIPVAGPNTSVSAIPGAGGKLYMLANNRGANEIWEYLGSGTAWNAGSLVALCTPTNPASSAIVGNHCYAVVGYNAASSEPFEIFNPWGTNSLGWAAPTGFVGTKFGLTWVNASFISQNFSEQSVGTGSAEKNGSGGTLEELTELAALSSSSGPAGTIHSARHGLTHMDGALSVDKGHYQRYRGSGFGEPI
jgi:hypothetical protein